MDYLQPKFYRFNEDSLWLVDQVAKDCAGRWHSMIDVGSGCGVVGIELVNRLPGLKELTLLEPQQQFHPFMMSNLNQIKRSIKVETLCGKAGDFVGEYDLVVSNPPYFEYEHGQVSSNIYRRRCRSFAPDENLVIFAEKLGNLLGHQGVAYILVHKTNPNLSKLLNSNSMVVSVNASRKDIFLLRLQKRINNNQ